MPLSRTIPTNTVEDYCADNYTLVLVNGKTLAEIVLGMILEGGFGSAPALLEHIDSFYDKQVAQRRPEEIFLF